MKIISRGVMGILAFLVGVGSLEASADLIDVQSGDLPIILSAPHGGRLAIEGVPERRGKDVKRFVRTTDMWTDELTVKLADDLEERTGKRPYVVIAKFHRKYLDANRSPDLAYESPKAGDVYDAYHQALASARLEIIRRWGSGILFDVHGQAANKTAIFRGTQNGKTTPRLLSMFGQEALIGESSLFGQFARQGIEVIPGLNLENGEKRYTGGHIVRTYGRGAMDAIQLELGRDLRSLESNSVTAERMTAAMVAFAAKYLPREELSDDAIAQKRASDGVRVAVYQDVGAGRSLGNLLETLQKFKKVTVCTVTAADIRAGVLGEIDVLIQPGGSGGKQGRNLGPLGREKIRAYLREGGGFIGICAGAYLASADYDWSLHILDAKVLDRKHWARGTGAVTIAVTERGRRLLNAERESLDIFYGQGPLLAPAGDPDIDDFHVVASYQSEIAKNGAPKGVMIGTTAIAEGAFGKGRVVCFSPHPEMTKGLDDLVWQAIKYVRRK